LKKWVSLEGGDFQTTFSRLKAAWGKAGGESLKGYGNWKSLWIEDGVLEFARDGKKGPQQLEMANLQKHVRSLVYGLQPALEELLPEGMKLPNSQVHQFVGGIDEAEFFLDSPSSREIIDPLYRAFKASYTPSITTWLKKEQDFLCRLLAALLVAGGVSPRMILAQSCQIRGVERNLFHVTDHSIWINSKSKANSAARSSNGLWAFPPQLAWPLYFYIGVIRPFSIHLLQSIGSQPNLEILNNYLFVHTSVPMYTQRLWEKKDTKQVLDNFFATPLSLKMDSFDLRQILQAVANRHLGMDNGNVDLSLHNQ
jgi:hypothetical protein